MCTMRDRSLSVCGYLFFSLLLSTTLLPAARAAPDPLLTVLSPAPDTVVTNDQRLPILARFGELALSTLPSIDVRITAIGERGSTPIAAGDLRSFDLIESSWDLGKVPPGRYDLEIAVTAGGDTGTASVRVEVRSPPRIAEVRLAGLRLLDAGLEARFVAHAESDDGTPIESYLWTPDDSIEPVSTSEPELTFLYPNLAETRALSVTALDTAGGVASARYTLALPADRSVLASQLDQCGYAYSCDHYYHEVFLISSNDCGCTDMILYDRPPGGFDTYCLPKGKTVDTIDGCLVFDDAPTGCPQNTVGYRCFPGRSSPEMGRRHLTYNFEVLAFVDGDVEGCTEGQYVRATAIANGQPVVGQGKEGPPTGIRTLAREPGEAPFGFFSDPPGNDVPELGETTAGLPRYAPDNYAAKTPQKKREFADRIVWLDAPGFLTQRPLNPNQPDLNAVLSYQGEFVAFVTGTLGTCWCQFSVGVQYDVNKRTKTGAGLKRIDGFNCSRTGPL